MGRRRRTGGPEADAGVVRRALADFERRMNQDDLKIADYVRLMEAFEEHVAEAPAEMTLRWTDKWESTTADEE